MDGHLSRSSITDRQRDIPQDQKPRQRRGFFLADAVPARALGLEAATTFQSGAFAAGAT